MRETEVYDVLIIGTGPAGLQAGIHAARKKIRVILFGHPQASALYRAHLENLCFVSGKRDGQELLSIGLEQVRHFGATVVEEDVVKTAQEGDLFMVETESGRKFYGLSLIFATGVSRKGLGLKKEKELIGRGVSYCVDCDANFYRGARVAVVGNESAAAFGALTLLKYASKVYLIAKDLKVAPELEKELRESQVELLLGRWIKEIRGAERLEGVILDDGHPLELDGLFIELGAKGAMELAATLGVMLDPEKFTYIVTNKRQETNIDGIYAAGDICGPPLQVAKALGEGCIAGLEASSYAIKKRKALFNS
ncbi:NAD(P)/FAD-dependent oxidoreductase [Thermosulfuriphilus ammonigenes]|uniref:NAD(P)/FAD-dependent oxidoreductase n=1 Tax=Thermosulfuriphilus ammonigenes TaxID=1936021 RepID=A0A6G7PTR6_9BACT|nr:NAD(P)/FAD-dependent oxidoreductase [Thermosulfuriphilus ammonigenes]MBA2848835.1 thioredoxin reductase (NADPH) [Thermosulfuriphilus ammonigenes]QIJ71042.1 NAD(P)/FAD-dependent oxidoreductase [Thermosulfuriphilus ammonigenes]